MNTIIAAPIKLVFMVTESSFLSFHYRKVLPVHEESMCIPRWGPHHDWRQVVGGTAISEEGVEERPAATDSDTEEKRGWDQLTEVQTQGVCRSTAYHSTQYMTCLPHSVAPSHLKGFGLSCHILVSQVIPAVHTQTHWHKIAIVTPATPDATPMVITLPHSIQN